jgi:predicted nucleotidyltransferase component of viral defense system
MLTYEGLLEEATREGMPTSKVRGIIREYVQVLMLKYLYRSEWRTNFFFTGGTSLRLLYGLKRFSEDVDFNARGLRRADFEHAAVSISRELRREGISCDLEFSHRDPLLMAEFIFRGIQERYGVSDRRGEIIIKLEAYTPDYALEIEAGVVNSFGEVFLVNSMSRGSVFADKLDTLRKKKRGRHVYDVIFMLTRKFPINRELLRLNGIEEEPKEAIIGIINGISDSQLEKLSEEVAPFLFDETESRLIREAKLVVRNLVSRFKSDEEEREV